MWNKQQKATIWTEIVTEKIRQQAGLLRKLDRQEAAMLDSYIEEIELGDTTNREGHAAKVYFNALFGMNFTRTEENSINAALNYGYGIVLSAFNREVVLNGYMTQLGLFHDNMFNQFNLGCDLMEPFRPLVDRKIIQIKPEKFESEEKRLVLEVLQAEVIIAGRKEFVSNAIKIYCKSVWAAYLLQHKDILKGWTQLKLIQYLQNKNPSVPGIANKIELPDSRDSIERVRKYWKLIIQVDPSLKDIYGGVSLKDENISIDHFVPWQYVAHDELWNLHPTTKSINSSKSNSLPSWTLYFNSLGELEYRAYELKKQNEMVAREFQKIAPYHLNNPEICNQLYEDDLNKSSFIERLEHVVKPVYESAQMLGFKEWIYNGSKGI